MRRRPLLRAAAVGGIGYAAGRAGANRRNEMDQMQSQIDTMQTEQAPAQYQSPPPQYEPPPPAYQAPAPAPPPGAGSEDVASQLERLADLRDRGVLSDAEFALEKSRLLSR
jgi:hypothetical protein